MDYYGADQIGCEADPAPPITERAKMVIEEIMGQAGVIHDQGVWCDICDEPTTA